MQVRGGNKIAHSIELAEEHLVQQKNRALSFSVEELEAKNRFFDFFFDFDGAWGAWDGVWWVGYSG